MDNPVYTSKRDPKLCDLWVSISKTVIGNYYSLSFRNVDRLTELDGKPFIMLPVPHTRYIDIPLEAILLSKAHRRAQFIMTRWLWEKFQLVGGYPMPRGGDIEIIREEGAQEAERQLLEKTKYVIPLPTQDEIEAIREYGRYISRYQLREEIRTVYEDVIPSWIRNNNAVVIHPGRSIKDNKISMGVLKRLIKMQESMGEEITFVPVRIEHASRYLPRSRITLDVGKPFKTDDINTLEGRLTELL